MFVDRPDKTSPHDDEGFEQLLAEALKPEPLPGHLVRRIRRDWQRPAGSGTGRRVLRFGAIGSLAALAAAACLTLLFMPAQSPGPRRDLRSADPRRPVITPSEAAEIFAAIDTLSWDNYTEQSIAAVDASLKRIQRRLSSGAAVGQGDAAWDEPPIGSEPSPRGALDGDALTGCWPAPAARKGWGSRVLRFQFMEDWS